MVPKKRVYIFQSHKHHIKKSNNSRLELHIIQYSYKMFFKVYYCRERSEVTLYLRSSFFMMYPRGPQLTQGGGGGDFVRWT